MKKEKKNTQKPCAVVARCCFSRRFTNEEHTHSPVRVRHSCAPQPIHMQRDCICVCVVRALCMRATHCSNTPRLYTLFSLLSFSLRILFTFPKIEMFSSWPLADWSKMASFRVRIARAHWMIVRVCVCALRLTFLVYLPIRLYHPSIPYIYANAFCIRYIAHETVVVHFNIHYIFNC